jgi:hypothetical protein
MRAVGRLPRFGRPGKQSSRGAQIWQLPSGREAVHLSSPSKPAGSGCTLWAREVLHPNCLHASSRPGWVLAAMSEKVLCSSDVALGLPPWPHCRELVRIPRPLGLGERLTGKQLVAE